MKKMQSSWGVLLAFALVAILAFMTVPIASAQETTGGIKATVRDKTGASVPKAMVELSGQALIAPRTLEADDAGYVYFAQVPPGEYTLSASAPNFRTVKVTGIKLDVGKLPSFDLALEVGEVSQTIEVTSSAVLVDVTTSSVATAIPRDIIDNIPKGRSFQSLIPFSPGARQEPLQSARGDRGRSNGFQIDGASDSENTYLVEGLDTTDIQSGGVKQNVVFEFVQEVQIKTSSYAAEYGGALGGVVNVIQKRGGDQWHGSVVSYFRTDGFDANDQCAITPIPNPLASPTQQTTFLSGTQLACGLRGDPSTSFSSATRTDQTAQVYVQKKDHYKIVEPGFDIGGPVLKDKLWFFSSYIPTIQRWSRTVNFTGVNPGPRTFYQSYTGQNMLNRLDYQPFSKLHLFASWLYGYSRTTGQLPVLPDSVTGQVNTAASVDPTTIRPDTGSVNPSSIFTFGGDWTPNSKTVVTARYGYFFYNQSDRGKPSGLFSTYQTSLIAAGQPGATIGLNGAPLAPAGSPFAKPSGFSNISSNFATLFDAFKRKSFSTDLSYAVNKWGTHTFKVGYGFNHLSNDLLSGFNTANILEFWGQNYTVGTTAGATACGDASKPTSIIGQNVTMFGMTPAAANNAGCRGNAGYFIIRDGIDQVGQASSYNHSIYFQDSWTVGHGLTLNVGVRLDKEFLPPYTPGNSSISFGFGDKVAPRIGGAYDLFHNGKLKLFASYGKFFDIMKYSLPRGSFGGEYWHDCVYAMDFIDYTTITPTSPGNHACGTTGPAAGVTVGRFIENQDFRASVISTTDPGVDPNMKPMSQHEMVVGSDWAITSNLGLEVRYARKRLDQAIEDIGVTDALGFYIGNPGPNTYADLLHRPLPSSGFTSAICPTCPAQPKAIRRYDGLETRLTYRKSNLYGQVSYTWSSLTGNYSGLTNTDITDGNGGRHNPNNHRDFDHPDMQFTTSGALLDGPLATDRPNVLAMNGYYRLKWWKMATTFGANELIAQGSPKSTCFSTVSSTSSCDYFDQRGTFVNMHRAANGDFVIDSVVKGARTPMFSQLDFNLGHEVGVSKTNEAMKIAFEVNVLNLLNQDSPLAYNPIPIASTSVIRPVPTVAAQGGNAAGTGIDWQVLMNGWDPIKAANAQAYNISSPLTFNNRYGLPFLFQTRRSMRMAVRFTF